MSAAPAPGVTDDERRTIVEMMAKGTYGPETVLEACKYEDSSHLLAPATGRGGLRPTISCWAG